MSYIVRVGNLAGTPELREGEKGPYTYARVIVTDRVRQEDGSYEDGATIGYDVLANGSQARELVATAQRSGNVRVLFAGVYQAGTYTNENGTRTQHRVRADEIGVSLRGQAVTVDRAQQDAPADPGAEFSDDTRSDQRGRGGYAPPLLCSPHREAAPRCPPYEED